MQFAMDIYIFMIMPILIPCAIEEIKEMRLRNCIHHFSAVFKLDSECPYILSRVKQRSRRKPPSNAM